MPEPEPEFIKLQLQSQKHDIVNFCVKKNDLMSKLVDAYCDQLGLRQNMVCIYFDGRPIDGSETATSLELEENDMLDVIEKPLDNGGDGDSDSI